MNMRRVDSLEEKARILATEAGLNPDERIAHPNNPNRTAPLWTTWRDAARAARDAEAIKLAAENIISLQPQPEQFKNAPLTVFGQHEDQTIGQMKNCMAVGNTIAGVICADGHLGYAQPVGGVIAYEKQISVSGVGFDIGCGNMAVKLDMPFSDIIEEIPEFLHEIAKNISFGVGRTNDERVQHQLFDDNEAWRASGMQEYKQKAISQLGTVGSGNHYVDLMVDDNYSVWIGVHFGSRGLGHTSATKYLKLGGGKDGIHVAPTVFDENSDLGQQYIAAMELAGRYAYAGREWVVEKVRQIIGGEILDTIHNHHNYAWRENHYGKDLWVVRKGATPAFPGQRGFVGGSMGDDAVIIEGVDSEISKSGLYSTIHGAGRVFGRKETIRRFTKEQMNEWLIERGVHLIGGGLDESPMAYRRLPEVLSYHSNSINILNTLKPFGVVMAGNGEFDPFKD